LTKRDISNFSPWLNLIIGYNMLQDTAGHNRTIREYLPLLSRYLSKNETDTRQRVQSGYYYALLDKHDEAVAELKKALVYKEKWGEHEYYNGACAYALIGEWAQAIELLAQSIIILPANINGLKDDPDFAELAKRPNAEAQIRARVEEIKKTKR
jgi:tetratricopeptide (TPR) repeat protein